MSVPFEQQSELELAVQAAIDSALVNVHTALPGTIIAFYPNTKPPTADVQLGVQKLFTPGDQVNYASIAPLQDVPVLLLRAGDLIITMPIKPGDSCLVLFSEREISQWLLAGQTGPQKPREVRKHSYSDGMVLPMLATSSETIVDYNTDAMEMRTLDGILKFSVGDTNLKMSVGGCTTTFDSKGITVTNGDVAVDGGITLKTHVHISGSAGDPTSPPTPPLDVPEEMNE